MAAIAVVDGVTGGGDAPSAGGRGAAAEELRGPDVPVPGALPGTLYVADATDGCRLRSLELATLVLGEPGPVTACRVWPSPRGELAVVARRDAGGGRRELALLELGDPAHFVRSLGGSRSAPSWSPDGTTVAWCVDEGVSVLLEVASGNRRELRGCFPQFLSDGSLVTRERAGRSTTVFVDGAPLFGTDELARAFPGSETGAGTPRVIGAGAAPDGRIVLAVSRTSLGFGVSAALELWDGRTASASIPLTSTYGPAGLFFGARAIVSPDGTEAALVYPETLARPVSDDLVSLIDLRSGRPVESLAGSGFGGLAWSPDGDWLAFSTGSEIRVYGADRDAPAYVIPLQAGAVAWTE